MRIALIGSRGIPARYSGFETFYEQLAVRLAERGHDVVVYNRSHFIRDVKGEYKGVRLRSLPCIRTKHLETLSHTFVSSLDALFRRYDIAYYCIVGNAPLAWLPRLTGARTLLNVDGEDWARAKWGAFARWYQRVCERVATRTPNVVIADALAIRARYRTDYGCDAIFAPYGGNIARDDRTDALAPWALDPRSYFLFVGRFVPENAIDVLIRAFSRVRTDKKLVLVGDAPYMGDYKRYVHSLAGDRVVFTGYVFGDGYAQLSSHAYAFVMPSGVDGTRPAILDQLGFGSCVLARDSVVNREVLGTCGMLFEGARGEDGLAERLQDMVDRPERVEECRERSRSRIREFYNWERVTDFYEDLFGRMVRREALQSYDEYLCRET